jgi:hypothetical protein
MKADEGRRPLKSTNGIRNRMLASLFLIPCSLLGQVVATDPNATPVPTVPQYYDNRVAVGSSSGYLDTNHNFWIADKSFYETGILGYIEGGQVETNGENVFGTQEQGLYQTYRHGSVLSYKFKAPAGHYQLTLKFVDFISPSSGQNLFNVLAQGQTLLSNLDLYVQARGKNSALDKSIQVTVGDDHFITLELSAVRGQAMLSALEIRGLQPLDRPNAVHVRTLGGGFILGSP